MSNRLTFEGKYASDQEFLSANFLSLLANGETISSADVSSTLYSGTAGTALSCAAAAISGSVVTSLVSGGAEGMTYTLTFEVVTSLGQTLTRVGFLTILPESF